MSSGNWRAIGTLCLNLTLLPYLSACEAGARDQYAGRDGQAEAAANYKAGKPLIVYSHVSNGVVMGFDSPGLERCDPNYSLPDAFRIIPEAAFNEGERRTAAQDRLVGSAVRFAKGYNTANFHLRRSEVEKICPGVRAAK